MSKRHVLLTMAAAVFVAVNAVILALDWQDKSWVAFGMAIIVGPIANGVMARSCSLACTPWVRRAFHVSTKRSVSLALAIPPAAIAADFFIIGSMGLHGC